MFGMDRAGIGRLLPTDAAAEVRSVLERVAAATGARFEGAGARLLDHATAGRLLEAAWDASRAALEDLLRRPEPSPSALPFIDLLAELRTLSDRLRDEQWQRRETAFVRVREELAGLRGAATTQDLVEQAVAAVCRLGFDRAIVSRFDSPVWIARTVHVERDPTWAAEILAAGRDHPQVVGHALVEAEIVRGVVPVVVPDVADLPAVNRPIADASLSRSYVAAPITVDHAVVGFIHADCYYDGRRLDRTDGEVLALFGEGLGVALTRTAVLGRLDELREDLGRIGSTLAARTLELWAEPDAAGAVAEAAPRPARGPLDGALTPRETDVLALLACGATNAAIAGRLGVTEGTVKTHVQAILRKLGAANRAEAAAIWTRAHAPTD
jgi:DNA-binding CsgD family transcriptional regulator